MDSRLCCGVESHRRFGRMDCRIDTVCLRVSYSSNTPNGSSGAVLPYSMALHRRCIGLDRLWAAVLRRYNSNDEERINPIPLPVTFHRAAPAPRDVVNAVLSALCRGSGLPLASDSPASNRQFGAGERLSSVSENQKSLLSAFLLLKSKASEW